MMATTLRNMEQFFGLHTPTTASCAAIINLRVVTMSSTSNSAIGQLTGRAVSIKVQGSSSEMIDLVCPGPGKLAILQTLADMWWREVNVLGQGKLVGVDVRV